MEKRINYHDLSNNAGLAERLEEDNEDTCHHHDNRHLYDEQRERVIQWVDAFPNTICRDQHWRVTYHPGIIVKSYMSHIPRHVLRQQLILS